VSDTLTADPRVDASEITVNVEGGVVTLTGTVSSRDQKRRAEDCAEGVSGVSDVTNNLRVNREDSRPEQQDVSRNVTPSLADQGRSR
jgi:osmotically-inducible protein OsmY